MRNFVECKGTNESDRNEQHINEHVEYKMPELKLMYFGYVIQTNGFENSVWSGMKWMRRGRPRIRSGYDDCGTNRKEVERFNFADR